jgi:L-serine dehydratase
LNSSVYRARCVASSFFGIGRRAEALDERNAIASVKAITATRMALHGDGTNFVSLDKVVKTMREAGADMMTKYKETARGGLAVNIIEC